MPQEPNKSNTVLIVIAIIGVLGTVIGASITVMGNINIEKIRQETELTRIALVSTAPQSEVKQTVQAVITQATPEANIVPESLITPFAVSNTFNPDSIVGTWESENGTTTSRFKVEKDQYKENCYYGTEASPTSTTSYVGEITKEFCYDSQLNTYVGRHIWGGGKSTTTYWGEDGGLTILFTNIDSIFVQYKDSKYSGGWIFQRTNGN